MRNGKSMKKCFCECVQNYHKKRTNEKSYINVRHFSEVVPRTEAKHREDLVSPVGKKQLWTQLLVCLLFCFVFLLFLYINLDSEKNQCLFLRVQSLIPAVLKTSHIFAIS